MGILAVNYDLNRSVAECIVEIVLVREEDENGFAGALNDLGPMIRDNKGWTDPEEPNGRCAAVPPVEPVKKCDCTFRFEEFVVAAPAAAPWRKLRRSMAWQ